MPQIMENVIEYLTDMVRFTLIDGNGNPVEIEFSTVSIAINGEERYRFDDDMVAPAMFDSVRPMEGGGYYVTMLSNRHYIVQLMQGVNGFERSVYVARYHRGFNEASRRYRY